MGKKKVYHSFEDLAVNEFGMKPNLGHTNDKDKLNSQREKFEGVCPYCKERAKFILGTNVITCVNPECKGKKTVTKFEEDGTEIVRYTPYVKLLSSESAEYGNRLFDY